MTRNWKELLVELEGLIVLRARADAGEARRLGLEIERISAELRRVWQMTDEQIGLELRAMMTSEGRLEQEGEGGRHASAPSEPTNSGANP